MSSFLKGYTSSSSSEVDDDNEVVVNDKSGETPSEYLSSNKRQLQNASDLESKSNTKKVKPSTARLQPNTFPHLPQVLQTSTTHVDDPSKHFDRKRSFAHKAGYFPVHIFLPLQPYLALSQCLDESFASVDNFLLKQDVSAGNVILNNISSSALKYISDQKIVKKIPGGQFIKHTVVPGTSSDASPPDMHISIAKPFTLTYEQIDPFLLSIEKSLQNVHANGTKSMHSTLSSNFPRKFGSVNQSICPNVILPSIDRNTICREKSVECQLEAIQFFANDERTRLFAGILVANNENDQNEESIQDDSVSSSMKTYKRLTTLTHAVDKTLKEYQAPPYYSPPTFHASIGSKTISISTSEDKKALKKLLKSAPMPFDSWAACDTNHLKSCDSNSTTQMQISSPFAPVQVYLPYLVCKIGKVYHIFSIQNIFHGDGD